MGGGALGAQVGFRLHLEEVESPLLIPVAGSVEFVDPAAVKLGRRASDGTLRPQVGD